MNKGETKDMIDGFMKWKLQKRSHCRLQGKRTWELLLTKFDFRTENSV